MGKLLSLGNRLRYPIVVNKLLKKPGDDIKKKEALFQYTFTWVKRVGDALNDEEWDEEQTTVADWDSVTDGVLRSWKIREGMTIQGDTEFVDVEETCPHSVQFAGLCGMCGKDMTETSWATTSNDTERARINMIHDQTFLTVSEGEASRAEEELQRRLLKHRKLSLVVDLDQTIIHACIDPTVGEWQKDKTSPNYEAVKDVKAFQLNDDGPRGLASQCWYYIKMRPGLEEFLAKVSEIYELHVYTMGTRAYALNIAKIVDPDKKLFGDRIISRDENGNMTAKSLARLFPVDTKMVVIIDDRADVWPKNRPNLIKVHPYDFFLGIGDINSSFLPKREELPKVAPTKKHFAAKPEESKLDSKETVGTPSENATICTDSKTDDVEVPIKDPAAEDGGSKISALEELVRMGGGDDQALRLEQAAEQEKYLEKQLTERPLLHMQEKLDEEEEEKASEEHNGDITTDHLHHRHNLLKNDDEELLFLEKHLSLVHKAFYEEYDRALVSARGGRVAQLKPGHNRKISIKEEAADLKIVPDIADVMPSLKAKVLGGTTIVMSGLVPLTSDFMRYLDSDLDHSMQYLKFIFNLSKKEANQLFKHRSEIALQALSFGAELQIDVTKRVTHLVAPTNKTRTQKVRQAAKYPRIKIVNQQWLLDTISKWEKQDETPYLVEIHDQDRKSSTAPSSNHDDESADEAVSDGETDSVPASQDEEPDADGLMPDDFEGGHSPIDDLKSFDWGTADDELAEFMESDSGNDSDASSVASDSSRTSQKSSRGVKRNYGPATDDEDSDEGSATVKKQRISSSRTTGLKTVNSPNSAQTESSLPTPGPTDENEGEGEDASALGGDSDDDLEAEMMREFEREEQEAVDGAG